MYVLMPICIHVHCTGMKLLNRCVVLNCVQYTISGINVQNHNARNFITREELKGGKAQQYSSSCKHQAFN